MCSVPDNIDTPREGDARTEGDGRADGVVVLVAESEDRRRDVLGQGGSR